MQSEDLCNGVDIQMCSQALYSIGTLEECWKNVGINFSPVYVPWKNVGSNLELILVMYRYLGRMLGVIWEYFGINLGVFWN